jgi:hypothetical protein
MRFFGDGPNIPDALIESRELGEVVFFCGAGISAPAGLPDFYGLADKLLTKLTAVESRKLLDEGESLDRVFTAMAKEFGGGVVDREIANALRTPRNVELKYHRAVVDLSRGVDGAAKIVTTNFDRLFERADTTLRAYVPPALPDLTQLQPIRGVVYLHGRLNSAMGSRAGYVISSSDFGRAYLAEGWAARFVRDLSERYAIVLLGYSANDPPMRYLLEGLSSRDGERRPIYAFAPEGAAADDESWRDKGVTAIPYSPLDREHNGLWHSLFSWAETARDPQSWRDKLVALAQSAPSALQPFQRGQVMHLVSSKAGAAAFASAVPPPSAEWLCVFDANRRYAQPKRMNWADLEEKELDPLELFGLDSDPPRPEPRPGGGTVPAGEDALRWHRGDEAWSDRLRLSGFHAEWTSQLPPRLFHLARWFGSVLEQPAAVWWASGNVMPHPGLLREIQHRLDRDDTVPQPALRFWRCYLEAVHSRERDPNNFRVYETSDRLKKEGWSNAVLRELEQVALPVFEIHPPILAGPAPPQGDWSELNLRSVTEIKVTTASWRDESLAPPPERLSAFVELMRRSLIRMGEMLEESTSLYWRSPTLHPTGERGESLDPGRKSGHFLTFKKHFDALAQTDPAAARAEVATWGSSDPTFFAKLFLYAATLPELLNPNEVAIRILAMPASVLWDSGLAREMLFALRFNWPAFAANKVLQIERRIIRGPSRYEGESRRAYTSRRRAQAASWLRWLQLNGAVLTAATSAKLLNLITEIPNWSDGWAQNAADSLSSWGGVIHRVTDPQGLDAAPLPDVVSLAQSLSRDDHRRLRDYRPFDGLVQTAPLKALSALRLMAKQSEWSEQFWRSLISNFPDNESKRLAVLMGHTIARLPENIFVRVRYQVGSWTLKFAGPLIGRDRKAGLAAFDAIVDRFFRIPPETLQSALGETSVGGVPKPESRFSINKAINSPGGDLAMVLIRLIGKGRKGRKMPAYIAKRLERLFELPGDGAGHAASVVAAEFGWLHYWFGDWAERLIQMFKLNHPLSEAMWHGLSTDRNLLSDEAARLLKTPILELLEGRGSWSMDSESRKRILQQMINLTYPRGGKAVISFAEARRALMAVSDEERGEAIMMLANSMHRDGMWSGLIEPFILRAWPRQLKFQGPASSRAFAALLEKAGDRFPQVVSLVLPYLRPVPRLDTFAYRLKKLDDDGQGYSGRFPEQTLRVLDAMVGGDQQAAPWNLGELLETIAAATPALRQSEAWRRLKALTQ